MNTQNRPERQPSMGRAAPVGMAMRAAVSAAPSWPQRPSFCPPCAVAQDSGSVSKACTSNAHPLADVERNAELAAYEQMVRARFDAIVPTLKEIAGLQHETGFEAQAQRIARERLGFDLPTTVLGDAWVTTLDMKALYGHSVLQTYHVLVNDFSARPGCRTPEADAWLRFFIECGFHEVDISPCADGRLKGLLQFVLRLPHQAVRRRKSYAGAMFDVEINVKQWMETELRRFREGLPTLADASTRYLKIAVYHFSSSNPNHEGCAAHGSNELSAAQAALDRLDAFRTAIENGFCCGASVATLLIGVDTDTDAIKVHVPDAAGQMSLYRLVDNANLFAETRGMAASQARDRIYAAIDQAAALGGWGQGNGDPDKGMRDLIARLLENNCSQIQYVQNVHDGRYTDIGHAERFINIGDGFEEVHLRNLAYFGHLHTIEEGAADMDVGIKIFSKLNVAHGLPIPIAIHYRYDEQVPGSRDRAEARCRRVKSAIESRYPILAKQGLLFCGMTIQSKQAGAPQEAVADLLTNSHGH